MSVINKLDSAINRFEEKNLNFLINETDDVKKDDVIDNELPKQNVSVKDKVIIFFTENPDPTKEQISSWVKKQSLDEKQVIAIIYTLATKAVKLLTGGASIQKGVTSKDVDANELKMGIKSELEHVTDKDIAEKIALDHLSEISDYYSRLTKMEADVLSKVDKTSINESIKLDSLRKFDKPRTQTAVKRAIDTLIEMEDNDVFDGNDASYVRTVISIMQKVSYKLKNLIKD